MPKKNKNDCLLCISVWKTIPMDIEVDKFLKKILPVILKSRKSLLTKLIN